MKNNKRDAKNRMFGCLHKGRKRFWKAIIGANLPKNLEIRRYVGGFVSGVFARFYLFQNYCVSENNIFQMKNNEKAVGILTYSDRFWSSYSLKDVFSDDLSLSEGTLGVSFLQWNKFLRNLWNSFAMKYLLRKCEIRCGVWGNLFNFIFLHCENTS